MNSIAKAIFNDDVGKSSTVILQHSRHGGKVDVNTNTDL